MVINGMCPCHKAMEVLQKEELEFILHEIRATRSDAYSYLSTADLVALLIGYACYPDNCRVMFEQDVSEILSDLIETGTEVEQTLVAELASMMLKDTRNRSPEGKIGKRTIIP